MWKVGSIVAALVVAMSAVAAPQAHAAGQVSCRDVSIPVRLQDGTAARIAGSLCVPAGATAVDVLVPGVTYNRSYWDPPYKPDIYSFVRRANRAGFATLAVDRLGTGESSHPASAEVMLPNQVVALHQVLAAVRDGAAGRFAKVALMGHSYGSIIAGTLVDVYPRSVDALITTGFTHTINVVTALRVVLAMRIAASDPQFAGLHLDSGYLTTQPGAKSVFYDPATTDPGVVAWDNDARDVWTVADLASYAPNIVLPTSRGYTRPVLVINGAHDQIMCGPLPPDGAPCTSGAALGAYERQFYGPHAAVTGEVMPDTGHDLALSTTAPASSQAILSWLTRVVMPHG